MSNLPVPPTGPDDWDRLIDNPFNMGPFSRSIKADDWWVITGMHVGVPGALPRPSAGMKKVLVLADTISGGSHVGLSGWTDVLLIGSTVNLHGPWVTYDFDKSC